MGVAETQPVNNSSLIEQRENQLLWRVPVRPRNYDRSHDQRAVKAHHKIVIYAIVLYILQWPTFGLCL